MASISSLRALTQLDEMRAAVELQRSYWGDDLESVIPAHMLFSLATSGGHVLAAFDGDQMVAILVGFLGTNHEEANQIEVEDLQIYSKRMIVLPEYRGNGVGYKLKKRQREIALRQGVRLITWTFDPLLAMNAHLNIRKLGAISNIYLENYYGVLEEGRLSRLGSSDRLKAEWWITNRRVEAKFNRTRGDIRLEQYLEAHTPILNTTQIDADGYPVPSDHILDPSGTLALLEIPAHYEELMNQHEILAKSWRVHTREVFMFLFSKGFVVTDFVREHFEGTDRAFYLLSQGDKVFERVDLRQN